MKYFVADPSAEMGIRQLSEEKVSLQNDGTLQYRHPKTGDSHTVLKEHWATDWDKAVIDAYNKLNEEIAAVKKQLDALNSTKRDLVSSSPRLQRIAKQLKLF